MSAGFYQVQVGDIGCVVVKEGGMAPGEEWLRATFRAPEGHDILDLRAEYEARHGEYRFGMSPLLIEAGERRILVDTAMGDHGPPPLREVVNKYLTAAGTPPDAIDTVIFSHLDEDHFMGAFNQDGTLRFPNARYIVGQMEYNQRTGQDPDNPPDLEDPQEVAERKRILETIRDNLTLVNPGDEIAPGVTMVEAYGHGPGQLGVLVRSGDAGFLYMADAAHTPIQCKYPELDIPVQYDRGQALETRRRLFGMAADENLTAMAFHFPFPCVGTIARDGDGFRWEPLG